MLNAELTEAGSNIFTMSCDLKYPLDSTPGTGIPINRQLTHSRTPLPGLQGFALVIAKNLQINHVVMNAIHKYYCL